MIKPLTSLRFFFAMAVFCSHLGFVSTKGYWDYIFKNVFSEGFLGVSFFFILSGFILAYTYKLKLINKTISYKKFYIARFARVYPLHIFTTILVLPLSFSAFREKILYHIFLIQSFFSNPKIHFSLNTPSWSISDEAFFYLLFPLLIFLFYKIKKSIIIIPFIMVGIVFFLNYSLPETSKHYWIYISPFIRIFDFIIGIILFSIYEKLKTNYHKLSISSVNILEILSIIVFIALFIFNYKFSINYRYSIYYWVPMSLIILVFALSRSFVNFTGGGMSSVLSSKILVYLGEISFAFYLLHKIVINYYKEILMNNSYHLSDAFIIFIITLIASIFAFEIIEKPLNRKIKNHFQ